MSEKYPSSEIVQAPNHSPELYLKTVELPKIETFPFQIIHPEEEKPDLEKIPSIPVSHQIPPQELVWLTNGAVKERVETLITTNPLFMQKDTGGISRKVTQETVDGLLSEVTPAIKTSHEKNTRRGIPDDAMLQIFTDAGYSFAEDTDGRTVMLVDATILAAENSSGRVGRTGEVILNEDLVAETDESLAALVPLDGKNTGIRPTSEETTHAIAIPVEEMVKINQANAPIEVWYTGDAEGKDSINSIYGPASYGDRRYLDLFIQYMWQKQKRGNNKFSALLDKIDQSRGSRQDPGLFKAFRGELLQLIQEDMGVTMHASGAGKFPYEPEVIFPYSPTEEEMKDWKYKMTTGNNFETVFHELATKEQNTGSPATLKLHDFFVFMRDRKQLRDWDNLESGLEELAIFQAGYKGLEGVEWEKTENDKDELLLEKLEDKEE